MILEENTIFSDHYGIESVFVMNEKPKRALNDATEKSEMATHVLQQTIGVLAEGIKKVRLSECR